MKILDTFILDAEGNPVEEPDTARWGKWFQTHGDERIIEQTQIGSSTVSTVFLGLNHNFGPGLPILWETLVLGGALDGEMARYSSRQAALAGHKVMCARVILPPAS